MAAVTDDVVDLVQDLLDRVAQLEQRISSPTYTIPNGSTPTFPAINIGTWRSGDPTIPIQDTIGVPTGLTASSTTTFLDVAIDASWIAPADNSAVQYQVTIATKNGVGSYTLMDARTTASNSIHLNGLTPGVTYGIKVAGINRIGVVSAPTPASGYYDVTTSPDSSLPAAPSGLVATAGTTSVMVTWNDNTEADVKNGIGIYEVQYATNSAFTSPTTARVSATIAAFTGLTPGTTYYFRVRAVDSSGNPGPYGSTVSAAPGSAGAPISDGSAPSSSPGVTSVIGGVGFLYVKWAAVANTDLVNYDVHLSTTSGFTPSGATLITTTPAISAFIKTLPDGVTALSYGTTYYIKIVARDRDGVAAAGAQGSGAMAQATSGDIAVGTITAASGIIASLDAGVITSGFLNAARIQTGAIDASKLIVSIGGGNLVANSSYEDTTASLQTTSLCNATYITGAATYGTRYVALQRTGAGDAYAFHGGLVGASVNARRVMLSWDWMIDSAALATGVQSVPAIQSDNGTPGGYFPVTITKGVTNPTTGWTRSSGYIDLPAGTTTTWHIVFRPIAGTDTTNKVYYDNWQVEVGDVATSYSPRADEILPGTIVANMIQSGTITSDRINATTGLDAGLIKFGSMSGGFIQANTLDVQSITSGTLSARTITLASSGVIAGGANPFGSGGAQTGFILNGSAMTTYKAGATTFRLDFTTGNAFFSGDITGSSGTFSGALSGATGTFAGALSGATGTFTGAVSGATITGSTFTITGATGSNIYMSSAGGDTILFRSGNAINPSGTTYTSGNAYIISQSVKYGGGNTGIILYGGDLSGQTQGQGSSIYLYPDRIHLEGGNAARAGGASVKINGDTAIYAANGWAGTLSVDSWVKAGGVGAQGYARLYPGDGTHAGYVEFAAPNGVRQGYIGWGDGTTASSDNGTLYLQCGIFNNNASQVNFATTSHSCTIVTQATMPGFGSAGQDNFLSCRAATNTLGSTNFANNVFGKFIAATGGYTTGSTHYSKTDIEPLENNWALDVIRDAPAYKFKSLHGDFVGMVDPHPEHPDFILHSNSEDWHFGPIYEDLHEHVRDSDQPTVNLGDLIGVLWAAVGELADQVRELQAA